MSKPWGRVSRRTFWRREIRLAKTPEERLDRAFNYLRAMAATAKGSRPASVNDALDRAVEKLKTEAEALADLVPAERLERGGTRR